MHTSRSQVRLGLVEGLFEPLIGAAEAAVAALEARLPPAGGAAAADLTPLCPPLVSSLEDIGATVRSLTPLGKPAVASVAARLWPVWARVCGVCALAPTTLLPPLCSLGRTVVRSCGAEFAPLLQPTVGALTAALAASPREGAPLLGLADSILEVFCDQPGGLPTLHTPPLPPPPAATASPAATGGHRLCHRLLSHRLLSHRLDLHNSAIRPASARRHRGGLHEPPRPDSLARARRAAGARLPPIAFKMASWWPPH